MSAPSSTSCTRNTMIIGIWDFAQSKAIVKVCKGNHLDTMGIRGRIDLLFPEEMLFLVEKSRMCLIIPTSPAETPSGSPCSFEPASVEECYQLMFDAGVSLSEYLVYAHIKSLGNILFRKGVIAHQHRSLATPSTPSSECHPSSVSDPDQLQSHIAYEVWTPKTNFARKSCPPPSFLLLIDTSSPSQRSHLEFLKKSTEIAAQQGQVPIKIASVSEGVVEFFNHSTSL